MMYYKQCQAFLLSLHALDLHVVVSGLYLLSKSSMSVKERFRLAYVSYVMYSSTVPIKYISIVFYQ